MNKQTGKEIACYIMEKENSKGKVTHLAYCLYTNTMNNLDTKIFRNKPNGGVEWFAFFATSIDIFDFHTPLRPGNLRQSYQSISIHIPQISW